MRRAIALMAVTLATSVVFFVKQPYAQIAMGYPVRARKRLRR
jgi:hypothetical protein